MKVREVVQAIYDYHPPMDTEGVDTVKFGDSEAEVRGIVTTCVPTVEVILQTAKLGCNLIICHEPAFYSHEDRTDYLQGNDVYEEKCRLLQENGIAVFRDHDRLHAHEPDGMYYGVMKELGWEPYRADAGRRPCLYELPRTTLQELAIFLKTKLNMETVRVIGNTAMSVSRVAYVGGGNPSMDEQRTRMMLEQNLDVMIAGELVDWTIASYVRDAAALGKERAVIQLGHFNSEDLGMKHYPSWLRKLIGEDIPIRFVRAGDPYRYL